MYAPLVAKLSAVSELEDMHVFRESSREGRRASLKLPRSVRSAREEARKGGREEEAELRIKVCCSLLLGRMGGIAFEGRRG